MIIYQHPNTEFTRQRLRKLTHSFQSKQINDRLALLGCGSILFTWPRIAFSKNQPAGGIASILNSETVGRRQAFLSYSLDKPWNLRPVGLNSADFEQHLWVELPFCSRPQTDRPHAYACRYCRRCSIGEFLCPVKAWNRWRQCAQPSVSLTREVLGTGLFCFYSLHSCEDILSHFFFFEVSLIANRLGIQYDKVSKSWVSSFH